MQPDLSRRTVRRLAAVIVALITFFSQLPANAVTVFAASADNVFTFSESGIAVSDESGSGWSVDGTDLTIEASGTYKITGSCSEGTVSVKKGTTGVTLILENLTLSSSESAPLVIKKNAEVVIDIEGTSTLTDLEDPANEDSTDETVADAFEGAAIKVKSGSTVTFTGTGTLTADGSACKNGIKGAATANVIVGASASDSFTLNVKAANNGLASDGNVIVNGGKLVIDSDGDGIKAAPEGDDADSAGVISITGGTITIDAAEDGIQASIPDAEEITVTMAETVGTINISGGTLNVTAGDDAIKADLDNNVTGGTITINAADDGLKAEYVLNVGTSGSSSGPSITVASATEGFEGATINLYSGNATITASDDGINAANSDLTGYTYSLNIYGGTWYINAGGDGLDSNGPINVYGGTTEVYGSANDGNCAVDTGDGYQWNLEGGTLLAVGMSGMAETPSSGNYVVFGSSGMGAMGGMGGMFGGTTTSTSSVSVSKGSSIVIKNASGTTLYSATAVKNANHIVFASDDLTSGETVTLYVNGSAAATATVGTGSSQGGTQPGQGGTQPTQPGQGGTQPTQPGQGSTPPAQPGQNENEGPIIPLEISFSDVTDTSAWYYDAVQWAASIGVTTGYDDGTFRPLAGCTRAQAVTFLYRLAGSPDVSGYADPGFTDVTDSSLYYYNAVKWAVANRITTGYGTGTFQPDVTCNRAMIVTFLMRYADSCGLDTSVSSVSSFSDVDENDWFYDAVNWAVANGITKGYGTGTFQPYVTCSRAMIVTFLYRM